MKLDNLQFDDDVTASPIIDKAEQQRAKQREYNRRWKAKKQLLEGTKPRAYKTKSKVKEVVSSKSNASVIVGQMSVVLAKEVYLELKKVFES
jgi:DNA recombination-dependent growth factor C